MGIDQPSVSRILRGLYREVSADRLLHDLNRLGQDGIITIVPAPASAGTHGRISGATTGL